MTLDLALQYHYVEILSDKREKNTFSTDKGHFMFIHVSLYKFPSNVLTFYKHSINWFKRVKGIRILV